MFQNPINPKLLNCVLCAFPFIHAGGRGGAYDDLCVCVCAALFCGFTAVGFGASGFQRCSWSHSWSALLVPFMVRTLLFRVVRRPGTLNPKP